MTDLARPADLTGPSPETLLAFGFLASYSEPTRSHYKMIIEQWYRWCERNRLQPMQAQRVHFELWMRELDEVDHLKASTINGSGSNARRCPASRRRTNGHQIHYYETENARLKAELDQAQADARWQRTEKENARERALQLERSNIALRGHLTRWRKRVANGVCPVAGCHRHFPNIQSHVATVHPDWLATHPEVFDG